MSADKLEQMMAQADRYLDFGNLTAALSVYAQILEIDPLYDDAYAMMGSVQGEMGNTESALISLDKALDIDQENADAWLIQGLLQRGLGRSSSALKSFEKAAQYADDYDVAHYNLALQLLDSGEKLLAVNSFKKAFQCNSKNIDAIKCAIFELIQLDRLDEAEKQCDGIINTNNFPWVFKYMADIRIKQGRLTEAVEYAVQAKDAEPGNIEIALFHADLIEKRGDYDVALELLRPMLENRTPPFNAVVLFSKFAPFLGMSEEAKFLLDKVSSVNILNNQEEAIVTKAVSWLGY